MSLIANHLCEHDINFAANVVFYIIKTEEFVFKNVVSQLDHHFGPEWNISISGWIAMKIGTDMHVSLRMDCNNLDTEHYINISRSKLVFVKCVGL